MESQRMLIGCEIELPLLPQDPERYRLNLLSLWEEIVEVLGAPWQIEFDAQTHGITGASQGSDHSLSAISYDASIVLLEFSLGPQENLAALSAEWERLSRPVRAVLARHGIRALGYGMQPEIDIHANGAYRTWCTPRGMYWYMPRRGWDHRWNLCRASTQPSIDVPINEAADTLNFLEKILPLVQPLCANSSIERWTADPDIAERRDFLGWSQLMGQSVDRNMIGMPVRPYKDMNDYLYQLFSLPLHTVTGDAGKAGKKARGIWLPAQPSLLEYIEKDAWEGILPDGQRIQVETKKPDWTIASIDWYCFRPARLRTRMKPVASWDALRVALQTNPSALLEKTFIEIRSIATQSPNEPLLPVALCLGLLRARPKLQQWVDQWTWEEIRQFATTKAFRFDAWSAKLGKTAYADVARTLVETVSSMMASDERHLLGGLHERMEKRVSPASLASKAVRSSRKDFLELVTYPAS